MMRIAVVYVPARDKGRIEATAKAMARELEAKGHMVDLSEARADETPRLTGYEYVVVGTESSSLLGKIPDRVKKFLAQAGTLSGKRSMSFLRKSGLRPEKALARLMKAMEAEGMVVNCAEIVGSEAEAARAAREAPVERY
jgi:menaquinone-dependent protoporphyrinogen IX oxidase